jgi:hypothetical protein
MASSSLAVRLLPETLRSLAFGGISGVLAAVGAAFANPIRILNIQNGCNQDVIASLDGVNDHLFIPANGFLLIDVSSNKTKGNALFLAVGDRVWVREVAVTPTAGSVYVSVFYAA